MENKTLTLILNRLNVIDSILECLNIIDNRFNGIYNRLDSMDNRFDGIYNRLDSMDNRFDGVDSTLAKFQDGQKKILIL